MSGRFVFVSVPFKYKLKKEKMDLELLKEDNARLSAELIKANLAREQVAAKAQNTQDVMTAVLSEVQSLQEGIDNLLVLLTIPDLSPGQKEGHNRDGSFCALGGQARNRPAEYK